MTKRETRKAIYKAIVKEGKSHQDTFDALKGSSELDSEALANEVSKTPSDFKKEKFKILILSYIILLGIVIVLRSLGVYALMAESNIDMNFILLMVALGIILPLAGIIGALTSRADSFRMIGILLLIGVIRSFTNQNIILDPLTIIALIPFAAVIVLAFIIPSKLKTTYTKKVLKEEFDGKTKTSLTYHFDEEERIQRSDLLDF